MRRGSIIALLAACALVWTVVAIPLCDFQPPMTDLSNLSLSFSYRYHNDPYGAAERDISRGEFKIDYFRLFDTPEYGFDVSFENKMIMSAVDLASYVIMSEGNFKRYFSVEHDLFAHAGTSLRSSSAFQRLGLSFNLGVGIGRFTDVTPLAKAKRINDYLVDRGSLTDHLHSVDLQVLALEIDSAASYETLAALLVVIQEVIETSGLVRLGGLDALDISEISRILRQEGFSRYCGWNMKVGLGYQLLDPSGGGGDLLFIGSFNYALATTPREQLMVEGCFSGAPAIFTTNRIDFTGSYAYFISDFLSATATYRFSRETWNAKPTDTHRMSLELILSPVDTANVVLSVVIEDKPHFLEWSVDIRLAIQMDLL